MIELKCPSCNATISLDNSREYGFCSYCGTKLQLVQKVNIVHEGTVNIAGVKSEEQILSSAKKMIDIGEKLEAQKLLENLVTTSPDCGEAWLGLAYLKHFNSNIDFAKTIYSNSTINQLKEQAISNFITSAEMQYARKLIGEEAYTISQRLVTTLKKNIDEYILQEQKTSQTIIDEIHKNISLLDGYFYDTESDGHDTAFFSYNGKIYYYRRSHYYTASIIRNNKIYLTFDSFSHYLGERYSDTKSFSMEILHATKNSIYTTNGIMWKRNTNSYREEYERLQNARKKSGCCQTCGSSKTLFGNCRNKCL